VKKGQLLRPGQLLLLSRFQKRILIFRGYGSQKLGLSNAEPAMGQFLLSGI
jgi:hypothetical protein